jgi:hypothetical protein
MLLTSRYSVIPHPSFTDSLSNNLPLLNVLSQAMVLARQRETLILKEILFYEVHLQFWEDIQKREFNDRYFKSLIISVIGFASIISV